MRRQREQQSWKPRQLTPYDLMQIKNCKTYKYRQGEMYPSVIPPISKCRPDLTTQWLADKIAAMDCDRPFDLEYDDVMDIWQRSPKKNSLSYYGVGSGIKKPEAIVFNQLIADCLEKVNPPKPKPVEPDPNVHEHKEHSGRPLVLNLQKLQTKVARMPTVQEALKASKVLNWLYCPYFQSAPKISMQQAIGMERPAPKPKPTRRRKYKYCELQCNIPENKCTEYEWKKYQQEKSAYEKAYEEEMKRLEEEFRTEPDNYDDLYADLMSCFESVIDDPLAKAYECCMNALKDGGSGDDYGDDNGDGDDGGDGDGDGNDEDTGKGKGKNKKKKRKGKGGKGKGGDGKNKDDGDGDNGGDGDGGDGGDGLGDNGSGDSSIFPPDNGDGKGDSDSGDGECKNDCPCEVCQYMKQRKPEPDSPMITQMKKDQKRRELMNYYKQMCHKEYMKCRKPEYRTPQHKCDAIVCDNCFCNNPKLTEYCECLDAMQKLQELLGPKHRIVNNELIFNINDIKDRLCRRICECV